MSKKRTLQDLYDEYRTIVTRTEELKDEMEEAAARKQELEEEINRKEIDLVQAKKIAFRTITFEDWINESKEEEFWIYTTDTGKQMGVWEGLQDLDEQEREHFDDYLHDYFYYNGPNYVDKNHPRAELSECELAFESDCSLRCVLRTDVE